MLSATEHKAMNGKVKVTWRMLRTIAHSIMVHTRVSEAYLHFSFIHTKDNILPILPIKYMMNKDGDPTTLYELVTGKKPTISYSCVLFCPCVVQKSTTHVGTKALNIFHQAQKCFLWYLRWNSTSSKRISRVHT